MQENFGLVYEVTHHVDADVIDEFGAWLAEHVDAMLELPGIVRASTFAVDDDEQGRPCGHCDACQLRAAGFAAAGVADPLRPAG